MTKFRAWNIKDEIMVYDNEDDSADYWDGVVSSDITLVNHILGVNGDFKKYEWMQYTGLKDKNGVEIYESDIVKTHKTKNIPLTKIVFKDGSFTRQFLDIENTLKGLNANNIEIIGNLYQNKDLIIE